MCELISTSGTASREKETLVNNVLELTTEQPEELHSERDSEPQVKEVLDYRTRDI